MGDVARFSRPVVRILALVLCGLFAMGLVLPASTYAAEEDEPWIGVDEAGNRVVELYFVYSSTCPHCRAAMPFVEDLDAEREWLRVWWLQADSGDPRVAEVAMAVADSLGEPIRGVPTFMYCGQMRTGYDDELGMGALLAQDLDACHVALTAETENTTTTTEADLAVGVPGLGDVSAGSVPLPVFTVIVAGLDAFNPCAFFVLLFLLSLLVHARSRSRMATVGGIFVVVSGLLYFLFMAAWLNVFLFTENLRWATLGAGAIAVVLGAFTAKDYFSPESGPTTSIPEGAKPGLFARMRGMISVERFLPIVGATVALAVVANSYELLCTAGLPMVFTRVLTLNELPTPTYYGYLALYNLVYVIPLLAIVAGFVWTLGSRKLQLAEGRALKLLSGTMMIGLGALLLFVPSALENVGVALLVIGAAVAATVTIVVVDRRLHRAPPAVPHG
jgi:hypothetical protein